jgi:phosphatidylglycerol:prolipoprotein diacylglycerol transferase
MIPFIHIWHFELPTFGLLLAFSAFCAGFLLHKNFGRYKVDGDAVTIIALATIAGVLGAKLWHVFETPTYLFAHPSVLLDRSGLAWFGGLVGGIGALLLQARAARLRTLTMLDLCAPSAALGYALGRIGCFTSGDGDYGLPSNLPWAMSFPHGTDPTFVRVQPTPLYECFVGILIAIYLWRRSAPVRGRLLNAGFITGEYLVWTGIARFLVEFIRRNPRIYWGMSNAQVASLGSIVAGIALVLYARRHTIAAVNLPAPAAETKEVLP